MDDALELALSFAKDSPGEAAQAVLHLNSQDVMAFLGDLPADQAGAVLAAMPPAMAANCLEKTTAQTAARIVSEMIYPARAMVLRHLAGPFFETVLQEFPKSSARKITREIAYIPESVGANMEEASPLLLETDTVAQALNKLRRQRGPIEQSNIVTQKDQRYCGVVTLPSLLKATDKTLINTLYDPAATPLSPDQSLLELMDADIWGAHSLLPVIGKNKKLVGVFKKDQLVQTDTDPLFDQSETSHSLTSHMLDAAFVSVMGLSSLIPGLSPAEQAEDPTGETAS